MNNDLTPSEEFHGLRARPFSLTPDLRFTYHSRSHTHALEQIAQALKRREGLVVVTGEVGTGKTMLCRALLETFETRTFLSVILDPLLTVEDLLHQVLTDFGLMSARDRSAPPVPLTEVSRHDLVSTLQKFLSSLIPLNAHAVIMIDEAQHLTGPVLEQVRLLSNFETDSAKLLQIVLVGQPHLDILLRRPDMQQLNQRVARRFDLEPLTAEEVGDYVERRLLVAGEEVPAPKKADALDLDLSHSNASVRFSPSALQLVADLSRGIPRLVNTVCDRALEAAFDAREHVVDRQAVLLAATRLRLPVPAGQRFARLPRVAAVVVLSAIVAVAGWWWTRQGQPASPTVSPTAAPSAPLSAPSPIADAPLGSVGSPLAAPGAAVEMPSVARPAESTSAPVPAPSSVVPAPSLDAPRAPAPGTGVYEITAASFKTQERATSVAQELENAGLPVAARIDSSGLWYRVVVGPFASSELARAAQETLVERGFTGTRISFNGPSAR